MTSYERVTYKADGAKRARSVYVENPREGSFTVPRTEGHEAVTEPTLSGRVVGKGGESIIHEGDRLLVLALALVAKREPYEMDLMYAELVPAGTAKLPVAGDRADG